MLPYANNISWIRSDLSMAQASFWLSLLVVLPLFVGETRGGLPHCDVGWFQRGPTCYKVVTSMKVSWPMAQVLCNAVGGTLVEPQNEYENEFIRRLASTHKADPVWLGVLDLNNERQWMSASSHKPVTYTDWAPGEPNNFNGVKEDCACLSAFHGYHWVDVLCTSVLNFLCQKKIY